MDFLKTVGGKIAGGIVTVAVIAAGVAIWRMDPQLRSALVGGLGKSVGWFALVLALPWATFFLSTYAARFQTNVAGILLVLFYTAGEATMLAWLFDWGVSGATGWTFYSAAVLIALVYNVLICDWIAERFGGA